MVLLNIHFVHGKLRDDILTVFVLVRIGSNRIKDEMSSSDRIFFKTLLFNAQMIVPCLLALLVSLDMG